MIRLLIEKWDRVSRASLTASAHCLFRSYEIEQELEVGDVRHFDFPLKEARGLLGIRFKEVEISITVEDFGCFMVEICNCDQLFIFFEGIDPKKKEIVKECSCGRRDLEFYRKQGDPMKLGFIRVVNIPENPKISMSHRTADEILGLVTNGTVMDENIGIFVKNISALLKYGDDRVLRRVLEHMEMVDPDRLFLYFPYLEWGNFMDKLTSKHKMGRFWNVRFEYNEGYIGLPKEYDEVVREFLDLDAQCGILEELERQMALINEIRQIYKVTSVNSAGKKKIRDHRLHGALYFQPKTKVVSPTISFFNPHCVVREVLLSKIKIFPSSTFPISIPLSTDKGVSRVIYKRGDDLTQDLFVLETIRHISGLINIELVAYGILVLGRAEGIIEMVEGMDFTRIKSGRELKKYILAENRADAEITSDHISTPHGSREDIFINSFCGYLVICYMMGIGDRNPGNMLITKSGSFFHIDFSYMLGKDPKFLAPKITIPGAVCEYLSEDELVHSRFMSTSIEIFLKIRKLYPKILLLWSVLAQSRVFELDMGKMTRFVAKRLMLEATDVDAAANFRKEIQTALGSYKTMAMHFLNRIGSLMRK